MGVKPEDLEETKEKPTTTPSKERTSPSALNLDLWDLQRGVQLSSSPDAPKTLEPIDLSDFHGVAFKTDPEVQEDCIDQRKLEFVKTLLNSPETQGLRSTTILDQPSSREAALAFAREYAKLKEEDEKRKSTGDPSKDVRKKELACVKRVALAVKDAKDKVEEYIETCSAMGCGPGVGDKPLDPNKLTQLFNKVKNRQTLRSIINKAGKFRRVAQSKQRRKTSHGYDDMVGITVGGDVGKLIPSELALLSTPETQFDAYRRLMENQALVKEYRGVEKVGKGPIIVCVDESGSMKGDPVENAKAFALAMCWIAKHQKRYIGLVGYSGGTTGNLLALPPGKWDQGKLLDWLTHFFGRGTDMDVPLVELPTRYWKELGAPRGKTDLILITDAICRVPVEMRDNFNSWKEREKVRCISIILNQPTAGELQSVSDEVYLTSTISPDEEGIERCLSI